MAKLRVFNVGHGEAMYLHLDNGVFVIRDFGRAHQSLPSDTSISIDRIFSCCGHLNYFMRHKKLPVDTVLSHAHDDHFNGFLKLYKNGERKIFRNSYIPWLNLQDVNSMGGLLYKLSLYFFAYYNLNTPESERAKNWILIAPAMLELSERLFGVTANHVINSWTPRANILWPPPPDDSYYIYKTKSIADKIQKIEATIDNPVLIKNFNEQVYEPVIQYLRRIYPQSNEGYTSNEGGENFGVGPISQILERVNEYRSGFQRNPINKGLILSHNWTIDDHSLVFELVRDSNPIALFLSDLTARRINQMIKFNNLNSRKYALIKSAHHGSRYSDALFKKNISADIVIHCCGPANPNWYGPDIRYVKIGKEIVCTDWHKNSTRWIHPANTNYRFFNNCCESFAI